MGRDRAMRKIYAAAQLLKEAAPDFIAFKPILLHHRLSLLLLVSFYCPRLLTVAECKELTKHLDERAPQPKEE